MKQSVPAVQAPIEPQVEKTVAESVEKENEVTGVVFPVKSTLRSIVDKENIAPLKQTIAAAVADWEDLDLEDAGDPLMVSDYVVEIFDYLRSLEVSLFYSMY